MNINNEVDAAYKDLANCRNPTTWQECAARARFRLEVFGVLYRVNRAQARRYVHSELAAVRTPGVDYDTLLHRLDAVAKELMKFALPGDLVGIANHVKSARITVVKDDMLRVAEQISAVPSSEWYRLESGGSENGKPYRSNPFPVATSHPDHDAES